MISMERDWVPILAARATENESPAYSLTHLNAVMRRIDLLCKLLAPIAISFFISFTSLPAGVVLVAGISTLSWGLEVWSARSVWQRNPQLRQFKGDRHAEETEIVSHETSQNLLRRLGKGIATLWAREATQMHRYFASVVWIPSLSLALLHLSVLQYSATFITFLLNSGFSLLLITIARVASSVVEVSSTFVAPLIIKNLARPHEDIGIDEDDEPLLGGCEATGQDQFHSVGLIRSGLWGITLQLCCLVSFHHFQWYMLWYLPTCLAQLSAHMMQFPVVLSILQIRPPQNVDPPTVFISHFTKNGVPTSSISIPTVSMFSFLSFSRLGLWVFDITTQELTQTYVAPTSLASFAGTEMSFVSLFGLLHWILAAMISRPEQFKWLALVSLGAVACSTGIYAFWVMRHRGHLVHWGRIGKLWHCAKIRPS